MVTLRSRILTIIGLLVVVFIIGTAGYMLIEGWAFWDALYMTAITLTTVGYNEVQPLTFNGRIFTVGLLFLGVLVVAMCINIMGQFLLNPAGLRQWRKRRHMQKIANMKDHVIICGAGRVGQSAAQTLSELGHPFVIVDTSKKALDKAAEGGWPGFEGDATRDETLLIAGIKQARGVLVCTGNDAANLFISLTARTIRPDIYIVARSVDNVNEAKMKRVGADKVISPYAAGGRQMANIALRPHVAEFMEVVNFGAEMEMWLEDVRLAPGSSLVGMTVVETDVRRRTGAVLVALLRGEARLALIPDETTHLMAGDELIALGTREQLARLEALASTAEANL
jgi:voltage-gated potassium channel